jgi:hypothetical protein
MTLLSVVIFYFRTSHSATVDNSISSSILRTCQYRSRRIIKVIGVERLHTCKGTTSVKIFDYIVSDIIIVKVRNRIGWRSCNDLELYPGGTRFESLPGHWLSWQKLFVVCLSPSYLKQATTTSFRILSKLSFIYHPFIQWYIVWLLKKLLIICKKKFAPDWI